MCGSTTALQHHSTTASQHYRSAGGAGQAVGSGVGGVLAVGGGGQGGGADLVSRRPLLDEGAPGRRAKRLRVAARRVWARLGIVVHGNSKGPFKDSGGTDPRPQLTVLGMTKPGLSRVASVTRTQHRHFEIRPLGRGLFSFLRVSDPQRLSSWMPLRCCLGVCPRLAGHGPAMCSVCGSWLEGGALEWRQLPRPVRAGEGESQATAQRAVSLRCHHVLQSHLFSSPSHRRRASASRVLNSSSWAVDSVIGRPASHRR